MITRIAANTLVDIKDGKHYVDRKDFKPTRQAKVLDGPLKEKVGYIGSPYLEPVKDKLVGPNRYATTVPFLRTEGGKVRKRLFWLAATNFQML